MKTPMKHYAAWILALLAAAMPAASPAEDAGSAEADVVLQKYVEALGGAKLENIRTRTFTSKVSMGWLKATGETHMQWPDLAAEHVKLSLLGATADSGYDGKTGWIKEPGKDLRRLKGEELQKYIAGHRLDRPLALPAMYPQRRALPDVTIDGRRHRVLAMTNALGRQETWSLDAQTGLLVRVEGEDQKDGKTFKYQSFFEDYREIDGIRLPFRVRATADKKEMTLEVLSVVHNQPVKIERPAGLPAD